jgi:metallo-beta-lactamase class B
MTKSILLTILLVLMSQSPLKAQTRSEIWITDDIRLLHLQDSVFMHTTWVNFKDYGRVGSNGMLVIKNGQALMVDTPMKEEPTMQLFNYLEDSLKVQMTTHVAGHYHADCVGGLDYLKTRGVQSFANEITIQKCKETGMPVPHTPFTDSLHFTFHGIDIHCHYFGGGHTVDNIVVYLPKQRILFGGCLIKSLSARDIGASTESVLNEWDNTVKRIQDAYPDELTVIPGHGDYGNKALLNHTTQLIIEKQKSKCVW